MIKTYLVIVLLAVVLTGCGESEDSRPIISAANNGSAENESTVAKSVAPWYSFSQVTEGARIFRDNCAECHGQEGEGASGWRQVGSDGKYPAPPLNGTGHGWHHPLRVLYTVVNNGSPGGQGNMPAWKGTLSDEQILAAIAWFQSRWPKEIYAAWDKRDQKARAKSQ